MTFSVLSPLSNTQQTLNTEQMNARVHSHLLHLEQGLERAFPWFLQSVLLLRRTPQLVELKLGYSFLILTFQVSLGGYHHDAPLP